MASSILHDDIRKVEKLLINAVHLVKSPANRKMFFLMKGEQMKKDELIKKLNEQGLTDEEIKYTMENEELTKILLDDKNDKKALDVVKDGITNVTNGINNALNNSNSISDLTNKLLEPLEKLTRFLSVGTDKNDDNNNNDNTNNNNSEKEIDNSVLELANEISGLANDTAELVESVINQ